MGAPLNNLHSAFNEVFANMPYIALSSIFALLALLFAVWLPNFGLITDIFFASSAPLAIKLKLAVSLLGGFRTNFSLFSAGYTVAIAILFGINIAMFVYFLRHRRTSVARRDTAAGFGGMASGALGISCAACGSFILSSLGAAGALAILPLRGGEFGIVSVILLAISLLLISKKIAAPLTCNIKPL